MARVLDVLLDLPLLPPGGWIADSVARLELERLGLHPYLPQHRRKWLPPGAARPVVRAYPLFPKYLFIPACEARTREVHYVHHLQGPKPLLCDGEGHLWLAPAAEIFALARTENEGGFDEMPPGLGDRVRLKGGQLPGVEMFLARSTGKMAEVFSPLFGGSKVTVKNIADLVKAV